MKVSERLDLNRRIAFELHKRYSFSEAIEFLNAFNLSYSPTDWDGDDDYYRQILAKADISAIAEITEDLGLAAFSSSAIIRQMPLLWENTRDLRVFVSHISSEKQKATRLRDCLAKFRMSAFVAHEDIRPTLEWQVQIERALINTELFISLHTDGFCKSHWTQQEVGYAVGRGIKIIAVRMGEDPLGFIQKNQALSRGEKTAEQISLEISELVADDERLKGRFSELSNSDALDDIPF